MIDFECVRATLAHSFDEWVVNRSAADPVAWSGKAETAVGRFTNFPSGRRSASRRGEVSFCVSFAAVCCC